MDFITILKCSRGKRAGKTHVFLTGEVETTGYDSGFLFEHATRAVSSLNDLASRLDELAKKPRFFAIRGRANTDQSPIRRLKSNFPDHDHFWVCIDIDGFKGGGVEAARQALPEPFRSAACYWQLSASHGLPGRSDLSAHLWFWGDRPTCSESWRAYAKKHDMIDNALFNPVQPHYTAHPGFVGMVDPVAIRSGLLSGGDLVVPDEVLSLGDLAEKLASRARPTQFIDTHSPESGVEAYILSALKSGCDEITSAKDGERNSTISRVAWSMGTLAGAEPGYRTTIEQGVLSAVDALLSGDKDHPSGIRTAKNQLKSGESNPRDLSSVRAGFVPEDIPSLPMQHLYMKSSEKRSRLGSLTDRPRRKRPVSQYPRVQRELLTWPVEKCLKWQKLALNYESRGHPHAPGLELTRPISEAIALADLREPGVDFTQFMDQFYTSNP